MKNTLNPDSLPSYPILEKYGSWSGIEQYGLGFIEHYKVVKVDEDASSVKVVILPETNLEELVPKLQRHHAPKAIKYHKVQEADYRTAIARLFSDTANENSGQHATSDVSALDKISGDAPAVNLVNSVILDAVRIGASDIHLEKNEHSMTIRYRVDGLLQLAGRFPPERFASVSSRIKLMANLNIMETRKPQDGRLTVSLQGRDIHMRLSVVPLIRGESLVLRLFYNEEDIITPSRLGLPKETVDALDNIFRLPHGLFLVTGPTGSGKTTTLSSFISGIKDSSRKIITIEDPVEYIIPGIDQIQVHEDTDLTFEKLLRRVLRQDPDVIMVGEIRDTETAGLAIRAALTGHLVLATLHTNDAPSSITRLVDMGIPDYLIATVLKGVLAQRLVRTLCPQCAKKVVLNPADKALAHTNGARVNQGMQAQGCADCNFRGYTGRTAISEWFEVNPALEELISSPDFRLATLRKHLKAKGYISILENGFERMKKGLTTVDELRRAVIG